MQYYYIIFLLIKIKKRSWNPSIFSLKPSLALSSVWHFRDQRNPPPRTTVPMLDQGRVPLHAEISQPGFCTHFSSSPFQIKKCASVIPVVKRHFVSIGLPALPFLFQYWCILWDDYRGLLHRGTQKNLVSDYTGNTCKYTLIVVLEENWVEDLQLFCGSSATSFSTSNWEKNLTCGSVL